MNCCLTLGYQHYLQLQRTGLGRLLWPCVSKCLPLECTDDRRPFSVQSTSNPLTLTKYSKTGFKVDQHSILIGQPYRNAGHSKWANIRHVKQATDLARSKEITKFVNLVRQAVREHGSADPKVNSKLADILAQVKAAKLPMSSLDKTLQNLQAKKDLQHCIVPIKGPGSSIMLVDLESDNLKQSRQSLNPICKKNRGMMQTDDKLLFLFDHKGYLYCSEFNEKPVSEEILDDATEHAIESGASDVTFVKDHPEYGPVIEFITEPSAFFKVKNAIEALKYKIEFAEVVYIPNTWVELEAEDMEVANKLYTKLSEHPDVQRVFVNIA